MHPKSLIAHISMHPTPNFLEHLHKFQNISNLTSYNMSSFAHGSPNYGLVLLSFQNISYNYLYTTPTFCTYLPLLTDQVNYVVYEFLYLSTSSDCKSLKLKYYDLAFPMGNIMLGRKEKLNKISTN